jgi:succinate--hydroxymethylglutarate CoA-transferase
LFHQLCNALGLLNLKTDEKYSTNSLRVENRKELISILSSTIENETCQVWLEKFEGYKFPYGPVNNLKNAFKDPQV